MSFIRTGKVLLLLTGGTANHHSGIARSFARLGAGAATYGFFPELARKYKAQHPGVRLVLRDLSTVQLEGAFAQGKVDIGFTQPLSAALSEDFHSRQLYREPLLAAFPASRPVKTARIKVEDLAGERFILSHRQSSPAAFDSIIGLCRERGFSPPVDEAPDSMQSVLSLVAAEQGVSIVPACALNLRTDGVQFLRLQPDHVRPDLVLAWPKASTSTAIRSFLDLVETSRDEIRRKARVSDMIRPMKFVGRGAA
jgi:DNA-binding transcriptional LysR family regulator